MTMYPNDHQYLTRSAILQNTALTLAEKLSISEIGSPLEARASSNSGCFSVPLMPDVSRLVHVKLLLKAPVKTLTAS